MNISAEFQLALQYYRAGNFRQAVSICVTILEKKPNEIPILHFLGIAYQQLQDYNAAIKYLKIALQLDPNSYEGLYNLGNAFYKKGSLNEAIDCYRKVIQFNPSFIDAHIKLGNALQSQGQLDEAISCYQNIIKTNPTHAGIYFNLGVALQDKGQLDEAISCYRKALALNLNIAGLYNNLGLALQNNECIDEAIIHYKKALDLDPHSAEVHYNLGLAFQNMGNTDEAITTYKKAIQLNPLDFRAHFAKCISQLPIIYMKEADIQIYRNRYHEELIKLQDFVSLKSLQDLKFAVDAVGTQQPFYLAYQGLNDRELQKIYGNLICRLTSLRYPQLADLPAMPSSSGEPLRIGFVSGFFSLHSNWKIPIKGWIENIDRKRFSLHGYYTGTKKDKATVEARNSFVRFVEGINSFEELCRTIREDNLHVLIYPGIGMDEMSLRLATLRLAPVQCTSWGHPETSGLPTIDYFISSDLMEPHDADAHYTEKLIRLPNLSIYYTPLNISAADINRETFNLRPKSVLYLCCQSLYKYLPQYDEIYPHIAERVRDCQFVFISNKNSYITEQFQRRIKQSFSKFRLKADDHVVFLPRLSASEYYTINYLSDVFLDSIGWSGCNSTLEAIAHDLPIVTLPGGLMRGRHSAAILTMMGTTDTIASTLDEYIDLSIRLGLNPEWRKQISGKIVSNKQLAYRDKTCITALEDFLEAVVKEKLK
jgi:protein O-GlcNAc transferase